MGPILSHESLKMEEGGHREKFEDAMLLALKMKEGDTSQRMQMAS